MQEFNYEDLLNAWLAAETSIKSPKQVSSLTYNESVICNLLLRNAKTESEGLTASQLCHATNIHKSQMNRILNHMEESNIIKRVRSSADKRKVLISFNSEAESGFHEQHMRIIEIVHGIVSELGERRSAEVTQALNDLALAARKVIG